METNKFFLKNILYRCLFFIGLFCSLFQGLPAFAHHPTASHSSSPSPKIFSFSGTQQPKRLFFFDYQMSSIKNYATVHTQTLGGEWSFNKKISALFFIPYHFIDYKNLTNAYGFGDLALGAKFFVFNHKNHNFFVSTLIGMPSGDKDQGLGLGKVSQIIDLDYRLLMNQWTLFFKSTLGLNYANQPEPLLTFELGVDSAAFLKNRFAIALSVQPVFWFGSQTYADGSYQLYLKPEIIWFIDQKHWQLQMGSKISLINDLNIKNTGTTTNSNLLSNTEFEWHAGVLFAF